MEHLKRTVQVKGSSWAGRGSCAIALIDNQYEIPGVAPKTWKVTMVEGERGEYASAQRPPRMESSDLAALALRLVGVAERQMVRGMHKGNGIPHFPTEIEGVCSLNSSRPHEGKLVVAVYQEAAEAAS